MQAISFLRLDNSLWTCATFNIIGWDTAGTESFRSITRSYYRGAAGCLLVYDVTSRPSELTDFYAYSTRFYTCLGFTNARSWLKDVRQHADPHLTCILVGNKVDLCADDLQGPTKRNREVTTEEAEQWAKEEGLLFVESSAKSGKNVEFAFEQATKDILVKIRNGVFDDERVWLRSDPLFSDAKLVATPVSRRQDVDAIYKPNAGTDYQRWLLYITLWFICSSMYVLYNVLPTHRWERMMRNNDEYRYWVI